MRDHAGTHRAAPAAIRRFAALATTLFGALYWLTAVAAEAPLTLPEVQRLAIARSRQLVAQDYAVGAARECAS